MGKKLADVRPDGEKFTVSLVKLTGLSITDVYGYITTEFSEPTFELSRIVFSNGMQADCEGEHDCPYLSLFPKWPVPGLDFETLKDLYRQEGEE